MNLEGFSKRGMELGDNPEGLRNETQNNLRKQYLDSVNRLALMKAKNDLLFEGMLSASIKRLSSMGLNVTRESIISDIRKETFKLQADLNFEMPNDIDMEQSNNSLNTSMPSQYQSLDAMVEAMANGQINTDGKPIVESMEQQKVLVKGMENGFAKVWLLGILATLVSFGIIVLGVMLK